MYTRAHVVVHGAVVLAVVPLAASSSRQLDHLGGLQRGVALVGQPQRLVVDVLVHVPLVLDEPHDVLVAPHRPGVRPVVHLRLVAPAFEGLVEVAGEVAGVAGAGAAQRLDVVQAVVGVLRAGQRLAAPGSRCASPPAPRCPGRRGTRRSARRSSRLLPVSVIGSVGEM